MNAQSVGLALRSRLEAAHGEALDPWALADVMGVDIRTVEHELRLLQGRGGCTLVFTPQHSVGLAYMQPRCPS